ncbi:MAG: S53 family peptidase [Acidimicrobiales bacterium]
MRVSLRRSLTTALVGVLWSLPGVSGATSSSSAPSHVREPVTAACASNLPAGIAHCSALIRTGGVSSQRHFHASSAATASIGDSGAYSPAYLQSAYNVASFSGSAATNGRIVAIVDAYNDPKVVSDMARYRHSFGLPACPRGIVSTTGTTCSIQVVNQDGARAPLPAPRASWSLEASIDVDMVSAICPRCQILLVEAKSSAMSDLGTAVNTAVAMHADVVSNSYGTAEYPSEVSDAQLYYSHPGVPIVAAAGELGRGVEFPAAAPNVVAVGGTTLVQYSDNGVRDGFETAWSKTSSGCSAYEPKPAWQRSLACKNRSVTDIAAVADPSTGVWIYDSYKSSGSLIAGGTSVAAPIISALFALAKSDQWTNTDPVAHLYQSASALSPVGNGSTSNAATYSNVTGLGSPGATPNSLLAFGATPASTSSSAVAPRLTSVLPSGSGLALEWTPGPNTASTQGLGYNVYESTHAASFPSTPLNLVPLAATNDVIAGPNSPSTLYFEVRQVSPSGVSPPSNIAVVNPGA